MQFRYVGPMGAILCGGVTSPRDVIVTIDDETRFAGVGTGEVFPPDLEPVDDEAQQLVDDAAGAAAEHLAVIAPPDDVDNTGDDTGPGGETEGSDDLTDAGETVDGTEDEAATPITINWGDEE